MTQQEVLVKCAAALGVTVSALGYATNLSTVAVTEEMQAGQLFVAPIGRRSIVCSLTREEYDLARQFNAAVREKERRPDLRYLSEGERPDLLRDTGKRLKEPPAGCKYYYLCRAID